MKALITNKALFSIAIAALVAAAGVGTSLAQDKDNRDELANKVEAVNNAAKKPGMMSVALQRISTQTGVPLEQVQALHKKHPDVRAGGLLVACVLAAETKKSADQFMNRRDDKGWAAIARENNVSIDKLTLRLDNVARELQSGSTGKAEKRKRQS
jgi:hypothetical protein